ncbi:MAG: DUF4912 domain-containing protein [Nitrospina sp.]|nr:MAG: DUF4912 domain-containing protein [Nitrospina sp.]
MAQTPDYRKMSKTQLTALARRKKIPVKAGLLKEDLVKALKKGLRKIEAQKKSKPKAAAKKKAATKKRKPMAAAKKKVATKKRKPVAAAKKKVATKKRKPATAAKKKVAKTSKTSPAKRKTKKIAVKKSPTQKKSTTQKRKTTRVTKPAPSAPRSRPARTGLPDRYGDHRLVVLARDPNQAYVYWELDPKRMRELAPGGEPARWVLRVYAAPLHPGVEKGAYFDVDINVKDGSYYLDLSRPGARFTVEIGVVDASGGFRATAQSNPVILPLDHPSKTVASPSTAPAKDSAFFDGGSALLPGSSDKVPIPEALTSPRGSRFFKPPSSWSR